LCNSITSTIGPYATDPGEEPFQHVECVALSAGWSLRGDGSDEPGTIAIDVAIGAAERGGDDPAHPFMEGTGKPKLLVDGVASPHTFVLKPSDAKALSAAQVVFRVSEGLEPFTAKLAQTLPKSVRIVTLAETRGLTLHPLRTGESFETHDHGKGHGGHKHNHGAKSDAGGIDGHIWLDPTNAKALVAAITERLAEIAPQNAQRYRANATSVTDKIDALASEVEVSLRPLSGRSYIVFHDAYQYFERRFGLSPAGSVTVSPDVPASAKRISELRRKIRDHKAVCVFAEPQFSPKVIDPIVEGLGVRRGSLDPLGAAIPAGPNHYPALLRAVASDLKSCLANPS
jgi:zinc transport system substrate-binding protein